MLRRRAVSKKKIYMSKDNHPPHAQFSAALLLIQPYAWLLQIIGLALAYFVTGKLGAFLAIPPGYATAIWPPSGIALAGILIYGYRVWPGILLGSFLVNFSTSVADFPSEIPISVAITLAISSGASLQAIVGAYLVRRFGRFPNPLATEKDVFYLFFFGGIVSTILNSTLAASTLVAAARIPTANFLATWGTWWMGDALGVFIFTPLVLVWVQRHTELWRNRRLAITLPIIAMFFLTTTAVFYEATNNGERIKLEFGQQAAELNVALEKSISTHINVLRSLGRFYAASNRVDRTEFRTFVANLLDNFQGIQALGWDPQITFSERATFEETLKQEGYLNAQISERDDQNQIMVAKNRPVYVPVSFIEPYKGNENALGYDVYSDTLRHDAIDRARDTGEIATTGRITLVQEHGNQYGILAFLPVFRNGLPHQSLEERRDNISGYAVAVFRGGDIVNTALKDLNKKGLSYRLIDDSAPSSEQLIFSSDQQQLKSSIPQENGFFGRNFSLVSSLAIPVGGRLWHFEVAPTEDYFAFHRSDNAWLILLVGLLMTSMVGAFAIVASGRGSTLRRLVEERTALLAQSEARFRSTFEAVPIGIAEISLDGYFLTVNQGWCDIFGYSRDELLYMAFKQLSHADNHQSDDDIIEQALAGKISSFTLEKQYIRKNGELVWGNLSKKLIRHADGSPDHFVAVVENIDGRKQAEQTMEASLSLLQKISSRVPGVVYQYRLNTDGSACFPFASDAIRQIYRVSPNEVREDASKVFAILHPDDCDEIAASIQESAQNLTPWHLEYRVKFDDGTIRWLLGNALPESEDSGATLWHGFITDITERKNSDAIFYAVFDQLSFLAGILDQQGRLVEINNTALLFADMPRKELIGKYFPDTPWWINPQERSKLIDGLNQAYTGTNVSFETIHNNPNGGHINVMFNAMPIYLENDIRLAVVGIDITQRKRAEEQLRVSDLALKAVSQGVLISSSDRRIIFVNDAFTSMTGYNKTEILGQTCRFLQGPLSDPLTVQAISEALNNVTEFYGEIINYRKDGTTFWSELTISPVVNEQGLLTHFIGVTRDITNRKEIETKLHLAANVFTHAREGIMITAADGSIIDVNAAFSRITGYSRDEVLNQNPRILGSNRQEKAYYTAMWSNLIEHGHWHGEIWNRRKDGEVYAAMQTIGAVYDNQGNTQHYVALFSDITMIKAHERELEQITHFDPLTGMPNRVLLADRLRQAMTQAQRHGKPLAVAFLDLDGFKAINDTHGHEAGDQLLIAVATRMKQALREGDTLARIGGDEFVAVLHDLADANVHNLMLTRLLTAAAEPLHIGNLILQVSASIGVTFYPQTQAVDADQLLRQADQAMYQAKLAGKNRYHSFDAEQDSNIRDHHESLAHIQDALDNGEFVLYYQPKVNMHTGTVIGAEALIRWQHPERGLLPPGTFLPIIEDHSLAIDIGEWVINTALSQMEYWSSVGLHLPISVNIGARQLQHVGFVEQLRKILAAHPSVSPKNIELEILETSALEDLTNVSQVMHACREIGVKFALDDFGTGYSSLTYLKRLPVNTLKIDQTFVRGMLEDPDDLAILDGVIGLAAAFRRQVIAEGVETIEHGTMLLQLGCQLAQGYGIAHPMPADQLLRWSTTWRPDPAWAEQPSMSRDDLPTPFANVEIRPEL